MYDVSSEFLEALDRGEIQHIQGRIRPKYDEDIFLDDTNLVGEVSYSRQCTSNESVFGIGQLYTGTAQITVKSGNIDREYLRGGTLFLKWCVDKFDWIPLGEWTITEPQRTSENLISITAQDCIGQLDVPINDNFVGAITIEARIEKVKELTGVQFAQTAEEIKELIGNAGGLFGTYGSHFCQTCRAEVAAIAEFMGGFAFADRQNRIKFRKIGTAPVLEIPACLRHKISLNEYTFGIRGIAYCDQSGRTTVHEIEGGKVNTSCIPVVTENPYIWDTSDTDTDKIDRQYRSFLKYAAANLKIPDWIPGEIEYYGNPALELGDFVEISGGINGEKSTLFLITAEHWQFRGVHTLISAGASENAVTSGGNSGIPTNSQMTATINTTKNISAADIESTGETSGIIAASCFDVREMTTVFFEVNLELQNKSDFSVSLVIDGIPLITHNYSTASAVHFSSYKILESGRHTAEITVSGISGNVYNTSYLWGQNISGSAAKPDTGGETQMIKETYKPVFAVPVCDTTFTKTVKATLISFDDYFMEV